MESECKVVRDIIHSSITSAHPTPYPEVNAVLHDLLLGVQAVLGDRFVGLYVQGSLASGDFAPRRSDVDFVVVTAGELPDEVLPALKAMHAHLTATGGKWATRLEGSYIPRHALRRYDPACTRHPALRVDGSFDVDEHGSDWVIQRHVIREHGITLAGPGPKELIDPVKPDALRWAASATLHEWWAPQLEDPFRLRDREYQAYAALTMCRALYTLQHGTVVPKPVAARWTEDTLGGRWAALIERALAWPKDPQPDSLDETLDFIRYTLERAQRFDNLERPYGSVPTPQGGMKMSVQERFERDVIPTSAGDLAITFLGHGTLMMTFGGKTIHVDPFSRVADYAGLPKADVVLITHEHGDHLDLDALAAIRTDDTAVVLTEICTSQVEGGIVMRNGDAQTVDGIPIEAVPAYNIAHKRPDGQPFHPKGAGNGYVVTFGDKRVYVAGDTENIPEMKDLQDIDYAFLPMNLPYTMTPEMVADAAKAFQPQVVYPYHFGDTDPKKLVKLLKGQKIEVRVRKMA